MPEESETPVEYDEYCPSCGKYAVKVGSEADCQECSWAEDRRR